MDADHLAQQLMAQFKTIAGNSRFVRVTFLEMIVGASHGVTADALAASMEAAFAGTMFDGADVEVTIVQPGQEFRAPGRSDDQTANGWEILVARILGERTEEWN